MKLTALTTEAEVTAIVGEWRDLADALPASTPYSRPSWIMPWWRHRRAAALSWMCFVAHEDGDTLRAVLPLVRYPDGAIRYAGHDLHDVAEALATPELTEVLWGRAIEWIRALGAPTVIDLPTLSPHDRASLGSLGSQVHDVDLDPGARIDLPGTWESYLERFSTSRRKQWRYRRRVLERDLGPVTVDVIADPDQLPLAMRALWELRERSWLQQGRYAELAGHARGKPLLHFLEELAADAQTQSDGPRVAVLRAGTRLIAAELLLRSGRRIWTPMCTYDPDFAQYSPGRLLKAECIRYAIDQGCHKFEFGRGVEQYKFDLGAHRYTLTNTIVKVEP